MKILIENFAPVSMVKGKTTYTPSEYSFTYRMSEDTIKKQRESWSDGYCRAIMHDSGTLMSDTPLSDSDAIDFVMNRIKKYRVHGVVTIEKNKEVVFTETI